MEIVDNRGAKKELFGNLNIGDIFEYDGNIYLKIKPAKDFEIESNVYSMREKCLTVFEALTNVTPIKAKLVLEDESR